MKTIRISQADRKKLKCLGSDKWLADKGRRISAANVIHQLIEDEYRRAFPPERWWHKLLDSDR